MKIGDRIKQRRLELGYSVDELAKLIGKNRATVYRYENNEIENYPTSILEPLANVLETTPAHLMGWIERDDNNALMTKSSNFGISDQEIYDLAAHGVGHNENLTDEEREDVKLAIQIALAKHKKDR